MKNHNDPLENNISRLIMTSYDKDTPRKCFTEKIISDALNELSVQPPNRKTALPPNLVRRHHIFKSKISQLITAAALVVVVCGVFVLVHYIGIDAPAYGFGDAIKSLSEGKTLCICGWQIKDNEVTGENNVKLPFEHWYDLEKGRFWRRNAVFDYRTDTINFYLSVCDGEYMMSEGRIWYNSGETVKTISYLYHPDSKDSTINWIKNKANITRIEGFNYIGKDEVDGVACDLWEGEYTLQIADTLRHSRTHTWLDPRDHSVVRTRAWGKTDNSEWFQASETNFYKFDSTLSDDLFSTTAPEGYQVERTKEQAVEKHEAEFDIYNNTTHWPLAFFVHKGYILKNGAMIVCWQSVDATDTSPGKYYEDLEFGGDLPKLPIEVYALSPMPNARDVRFKGYHLLHTQKNTAKGIRYYEWSLFIPDKEAPPPENIFGYQIYYRQNADEDKVLDVVQSMLSSEEVFMVESAADFKTIVLPAINDLNDVDHLIPEYFTYENVINPIVA